MSRRSPRKRRRFKKSHGLVRRDNEFIVASFTTT
jgi:hypothetical protein